MLQNAKGKKRLKIALKISQKIKNRNGEMFQY